MAQYIHKLRAAVRLSMPGQDPLDGELALAPVSPIGSGPETILELLNSPHHVIPLMLGSDDGVLLVNRLNINWVMAGHGVDSELVGPRTFLVTREETVHVTLADGAAIDGLIQMELPADKNRVSDFLNAPEEFFALRTRLGIVMVNKTHVRDIRVTQPSPKPVSI